MNNYEGQNQIKLRYLQEELKQSQEELVAYKNLVDLNKEVIRQLQKEINTNNTIPTSKGLSTNENAPDRSFQALLDENAHLYRMNQLYQKQRDEARSQALINEQLSESVLQRESEQSEEQQAIIKKLKYLLLESENQRINLEKSMYQTGKFSLVPVRQVDEFKHCFLQVVELSSQNIFYNERYEELFQKYQRIHKENEILNDQKKEITLMKNYLSDQVKSLQSQLQNQLQQSIHINDNNKQQQGDEDQASSKGSEAYSSDLEQELPNKIKPQNQEGFKIALPKLDIQKAQKVMKLTLMKQEKQDEEQEILQKQKEIQKKQILHQNEKGNNHQNNFQEKISQTPSQQNSQLMFTSPNKLHLQLEKTLEQLRLAQKELEHSRSSLQDELLKTKGLENECSQIRRDLETCLHINELLVKSQTQYEEKWVKMRGLFKTYYKFYIKNEGQKYNFDGDNDDSVVQVIFSPKYNPKGERKSETFLQYQIPE